MRHPLVLPQPEGYCHRQLLAQLPRLRPAPDLHIRPERQVPSLQSGDRVTRPKKSRLTPCGRQPRSHAVSGPHAGPDPHAKGQVLSTQKGSTVKIIVAPLLLFQQHRNKPNIYTKMKNFLCHKCKTQLQNASTPGVPNCPGGGHHQWTDLGEVGSTNYQCKKCGALVQSKSTPSFPNCPATGHHQWTKL